MKKHKKNLPSQKNAVDDESKPANLNGPDVPALTTSEIAQLHDKIGYNPDSSAPGDLGNRLHDWAVKLKPAPFSHFTEEGICGARALNQLIRNGLHLELKDQNGNQLYPSADTCFKTIGLHDRKYASKIMLTERAYARLTPELKLRVKKRGTIEPLLPLLKDNKAFDKACELLEARTGKLTGELVGTAARAATASLQQTPKEFEESERKRTEQRLEQLLGSLSDKLLKALKGLPTACKLITKDLPEAIDRDREQMRTAFTGQPTDSPKESSSTQPDVVAKSATPEKETTADSETNTPKADASNPDQTKQVESPGAVTAPSAPAVEVDSNETGAAPQNAASSSTPSTEHIAVHQENKIEPGKDATSSSRPARPHKKAANQPNPGTQTQLPGIGTPVIDHPPFISMPIFDVLNQVITFKFAGKGNATVERKMIADELRFVELKKQKETKNRKTPYWSRAATVEEAPDIIQTFVRRLNELTTNQLKPAANHMGPVVIVPAGTLPATEAEANADTDQSEAPTGLAQAIDIHGPAPQINPPKLTWHSLGGDKVAIAHIDDRVVTIVLTGGRGPSKQALIDAFAASGFVRTEKKREWTKPRPESLSDEQVIDQLNTAMPSILKAGE